MTFAERIIEIRELIGDRSKLFEMMLQYVDNIEFTDAESVRTSAETTLIVNTLVNLAQMYSPKVKQMISKCNTTFEKMHVVDKLFGLDFLSQECGNFILDMLKLYDTVLNDANFSIECDGEELIIGDEATGIKHDKHFGKVMWQDCMSMRSRINRTIINTFETVFKDEFDRLMLDMLKNVFNYFVLIEG